LTILNVVTTSTCIGNLVISTDGGEAVTVERCSYTNAGNCNKYCDSAECSDPCQICSE
ncbi:uncharacterized protein METZ01_LOCUS412814, partial [marine metagenome]